jgi:UDP-N-acetylglucosamine 2-epimerase (non-hydrolysing)
MKKILVIFGTRPEAIKLVPVIEELNKHSLDFKTLICVTGQHRQMLDQVLKIFSIKPDFDLNIMFLNQDLFNVTINILDKLREVLKKEKPDLILVQGDTTTTFVASLSAFYLKIPIGHIEAGLRTYNKYQPFPEEKNRHLVSVLTDFHFTPTERTKSNLLKEGIKEDKIFITGNTVIDALFLTLKKIKESNFKPKELEKIDFVNKKLILVTGHRRENFGRGFENICLALKEIAQKRKNVNIVYPVHLNPNVYEPVKRILANQSNIYLLEPLEYESFIFLMNVAYLILTDSGGIQEEAPSLGKPVLIMRETTERLEGIEAGIAKLIGTDKKNIIIETEKLLNNYKEYKKMVEIKNPYGDGNSAKKIIDILRKIK